MVVRQPSRNRRGVEGTAGSPRRCLRCRGCVSAVVAKDQEQGHLGQPLRCGPAVLTGDTRERGGWTGLRPPFGNFCSHIFIYQTHILVNHRGEGSYSPPARETRLCGYPPDFKPVEILVYHYHVSVCLSLELKQGIHVPVSPGFALVFGQARVVDPAVGWAGGGGGGGTVNFVESHGCAKV